MLVLQHREQRLVTYDIDPQGQFVVENYNWANPASSFLPGIGGKWGIPMWIYYVNRAQCIATIGTKDKNGAIIEFQSFKNATQLTGIQGFRTFLKIADGTIYEPFQRTTDDQVRQRMTTSSEELAISDVNSALALETNVRYFPLVGEPVAALVRELRVTNLARHAVELELVDGLPKVLPHGITQQLIKSIPWHIQGLMGVDQIDGVPVFRLKQTAEDIPEVGRVRGGVFYFAFMDDVREILRSNLIVDPQVIFGDLGDYAYPWMLQDHSLESLLSMPQVRENRTLLLPGTRSTPTCICLIHPNHPGHPI